MAKQTMVTLIDDIDGTAADETVGFALDGTNFEIDLNSKNAAALRKTLQPYVEVARRATTPAKRSTRGRSSSAGAGDADAIRAWARANGRQVSDRGRISAALRAEYEAAN